MSRWAAQQRAMDRAFGVDLLDHARLLHDGAAAPAASSTPTSPVIRGERAPGSTEPRLVAPRPLAPRPIQALGGPAVPAPRPIAPLGTPATTQAARASDRPTASPAGSEAIGIGGIGRRLELVGERLALLEALRERHARECPHCTRASGHTNLVFGEGAADAALVFVGEAPGETEDQTGRPFVGKAGQKLDEM
ncbi:MAG: hypothetical protein RLZZ217_1511, partial [Planctomycetota bacterium]